MRRHGKEKPGIAHLALRNGVCIETLVIQLLHCVHALVVHCVENVKVHIRRVKLFQLLVEELIMSSCVLTSQTGSFVVRMTFSR